ncbi:MAG: hypothetical protein AB8H86_33740 [Polyangiales bacterium]
MQSSRPLGLCILSLVLSLTACTDDGRRTGFVDASVGRDSVTLDARADAPSMVDASADTIDLDAAMLADTSVDAGAPDSGRDAMVPDGGPGGLLPQAGDLVIVEIQGNPVRATDEQGEYLELLNVSGRVLDLSGVTLTHISFVGGEPDVSADRHTIANTLFVEPGERVLLGSSDGGFFGAGDPDYVYSDILISNAETETTRFRLMVPDWDRSEPPNLLDVVDEVIVESRLFGNAVRGQAWQFDPARGTATAASNDDPANWCTTDMAPGLEYRAGNFGTPGDPNACD